MARRGWIEREQPLLEAVRDLEDGGAVQNAALAEHSGLSDGDVALGLQALMEGGYVTGMEMKGLSGPGTHLFGARLLPAGRIKVGQWPGDDAAAALLAVLDEVLATTQDPEVTSHLQQARAGLRGLTQKVLTEVAVGYAKRVSGLDG